MIEFLLVLFFIIWSPFSVGDQLYQEGFYDQGTLPGGPGDDRGLPNYPFTTVTNRYSDGITSTSAFTSTSPRFPDYEGASSNASDRYLYYVRYKENAAAQGVAIYGDDGDQVKEAARLLITSQSGYQNLPPPNMTFIVYAAIKWNPTVFAIQEGEEYNITVFGSQIGVSDQFWYDGGIRVNAEGYSSYFDGISNCYVAMGRCRSHLKKRRRIPTANWMSLGCAIGLFVRPLVQIEPGEEASYRWLPLDEGALGPTLFNVGKTVQFTAKYTGQLICFANDAHTLYWNNKGSLRVTITRTSWPPSSTATYEPGLLPSCDSAQVVFVNHGINTNATDKIVCNPYGGGSGWTESQITSSTGSYGSGAPNSFFDDLSASALEDDQIIGN
jgi:hypothetical protein